MKIHLIEDPYHMERGKIAFCIFSFAGDAGCLSHCVERLHVLTYPTEFDIHVFDDAEHPLQSVPHGVHYHKTYFHRNGNLNGTECAQGMIMCMLQAARESRAEYICKLDSDMLVLNFERFMQPLKENPLSVIGFKLNARMQYAAGVCYILPVTGLYEAIRGFHMWYEAESAREDFATHCPEDWAITRAVSALNDYPLLLFNQVDKPSSWLLSPFNYDEIMLGDTNGEIHIHPLIHQRFLIYDFINFGNRYQIARPEARDIAATCMGLYLSFLKDSTQRPTEQSNFATIGKPDADNQHSCIQSE